MTKRCFIWDLDGTLCNSATRAMKYLTKDHKDWEGFYSEIMYDEPYPVMLTLYRATQLLGHNIISTGRHYEHMKPTRDWMYKHQMWADRIFMRQDDDYREDYIVKHAHLGMIRDLGYEPLLVFEDRTQCVKMYREEGLTCLQCADGDY